MTFKKLFKAIFVLLIFAIIGFVYLANRDITKIYGGLTKRVEVSQFKAISDKIVFKNVSILSADSASFVSKQNVTIDKGIIVSINDEFQASENETVVDASGKYLVPGFSDTHVHLFKSPNDLLLYVANGVTQVRELIGEEDHLSWKAEIENGRLGPDLFVASPRIGSFDSVGGFFMEWSQGFLNINNADDAVTEVKRLHRQGYDAVKIYSQINRETYFAVSKTAKSLGMKVIGHIPWAVEMTEIYSYHDSVAHLEELMNALNREFGKTIESRTYTTQTADQFLEYVANNNDKLAIKLSEKGIAVSTTLWLVESFVRQKFELTKILSEVELAYENPGISEWTPNVPEGGLGWLPGVNRYAQSGEITEEEAAARRKYWQTYSKACQMILMSLIRNGVDIMTGTDANLPPTVPGFSLHDEFISLNKAGMSAAHILKATTQSPAKWLGTNTGQVAEGFKANLVLLDKDPLIDIRHTKSINSVVVNGKLLDRTALDNILASVKTANDFSRTRDIRHLQSK